ncbi:hypothetical protein CTA2_489 [Colletotrichum tanaceti]|uniref:Uncharacterized protein n=1 Tax=Colletotrichum tanaceti TaxID=1306861 RepID=A0A4U6XDB9_9PEZI|nr:hypothetical protein CTA2_489 [Colletotrichum tanaceti]TKW53770.1 hypothetical protein CTA1_3346 [Colletotrichum tanaceti]
MATLERQLQSGVGHSFGSPAVEAGTRCWIHYLAGAEPCWIRLHHLGIIDRRPTQQSSSPTAHLDPELTCTTNLGMVSCRLTVVGQAVSYCRECRVLPFRIPSLAYALTLLSKYPTLARKSCASPASSRAATSTCWTWTLSAASASSTSATTLQLDDAEFAKWKQRRGWGLGVEYLDASEGHGRRFRCGHLTALLLLVSARLNVYLTFGRLPRGLTVHDVDVGCDDFPLGTDPSGYVLREISYPLRWIKWDKNDRFFISPKTFESWENIQGSLVRLGAVHNGMHMLPPLGPGGWGLYLELGLD